MGERLLESVNETSRRWLGGGAGDQLLREGKARLSEKPCPSLWSCIAAGTREGSARGL